MILAVFFLCTGFGTSFDNNSGHNFRGLASDENASRIQELERTICDQNQQISDLESRIEELIATSEETIAAVNEANDDEEEEAESAEEVAETDTEEETETEVSTPQIVLTAGAAQDPSMMMFFMMMQQQASQMTMFQATMAEIQSTQSVLMANQGHMMSNLNNAYSMPLMQYSQYPSVYNFGNTYGFNNGLGLGSANSTNSSTPDINRYPGTSLFHSIPLRQSHIQNQMNPNHMFNFLPEPLNTETATDQPQTVMI